MRVAIDLTALAYNFTGIERYACEMTKAMLRLGTEDSFTLLFKDEVFPDFVEWANDNRVTARIIHSGNRSKLLFTQLTLPAALRKIDSDVYLFMAFPAPVLFFSKNAVSTIHDLSCWDCPQTMTVKSRLLWRVLDAKAAHGRIINTISAFSRSRIVEHYHVPEERVTVSYCGISEAFERTVWRKTINTEEVRIKYGLPDRYVLSLSTIEPRKNISELIEAWRIHQRDCKYPIELVLAGRKGWMSESLLSGLTEEELSHVHVTGFVDDKDLPAVYGMAQTFVFPSVYEGFGLPPVEAYTAGARVVCSKTPCLTEIMGESAEYYELGDVKTLSTILVRESSVTEQRETRKYLEKYSWESQASKLLDCLHSSYLANKQK